MIELSFSYGTFMSTLSKSPDRKCKRLIREFLHREECSTLTRYGKICTGKDRFDHMTFK